MTIVVPFKQGTIPGYVVARRVLKEARRTSSVSLASMSSSSYYQCLPNVPAMAKIIMVSVMGD